MDRKLGLATALFIVLMGIGSVLAEIAVGVKEGDWIEYQITYTGTPPPDHEVTWAIMEAVIVHGNVIDLNLTTRFASGLLSNKP